MMIVSVVMPTVSMMAAWQRVAEKHHSCDAEKKIIYFLLFILSINLVFAAYISTYNPFFLIFFKQINEYYVLFFNNPNQVFEPVDGNESY